MLVDGIDSWRYTYVGHDQIWAERLHIWCITCKKNKCTDLSNAMQLLLSDPGYNKLSDMDKLRTLQFKAITPSLPRYDPDESWSLIYHANFYINYTLLKEGLGTAIETLQTGITTFSQIEVRD